MSDNLKEKITPIESMTTALETLRLNAVIKAPNFQRVSANGTIQRLKDTSSKKFSCKRFDTYFTIKRTR